MPRQISGGKKLHLPLCCLKQSISYWLFRGPSFTKLPLNARPWPSWHLVVSTVAIQARHWPHRAGADRAAQTPRPGRPRAPHFGAVNCGRLLIELGHSRGWPWQRLSQRRARSKGGVHWVLATLCWDPGNHAAAGIWDSLSAFHRRSRREHWGHGFLRMTGSVGPEAELLRWRDKNLMYL